MDDASQTHMFENGGSQRTGFPVSKPRFIYLTRTELSAILNVYGKLVAAGEWHDYAIDHLEDFAVFSIFRRASDMPLYRIIKDPTLARKQGVWRITGMNGQILKRGKDLRMLLRYFDRLLLKAVP